MAKGWNLKRSLLQVGFDGVEELARIGAVAALTPADAHQRLAAVCLFDVDADLLVVGGAGEDLGFEFIADLVGLEEAGLLNGFLRRLVSDGSGRVEEHLELAESEDGEGLARLIVRHGAAATKDSERDQQKGRKCEGLDHRKRLKRPHSKGKVQAVRR